MPQEFKDGRAKAQSGSESRLKSHSYCMQILIQTLAVGP